MSVMQKIKERIGYQTAPDSVMNKKFFKRKIKETFKLISFILVFLVLLEVCSLTLFSNKSAANFSNKYQDAYSFVNEPDNSIQIAAFGNSDLYSALSPLDLWNEYKNTATVCASPKQTVQDSQSIAECLFKTQKPDIVIIETDMFYDKAVSQGNKIALSSNLSDIFDALNPDYFDTNIKNIFTVFRFHNKWQFSKNMLKKAVYNTHGYNYNNQIVRLSSVNYMEKTDTVEPISKATVKQADKLISYCQEKGAKVILVEMPSVFSWNYQRHNAVQQYADDNKLPFIDFNLLYDEVGISQTDCFRDMGNHLNYSAAKSVTEYIGKYIRNNYAINDLSNDKAYVSWDENYNSFVNSTKEK